MSIRLNAAAPMPVPTSEERTYAPSPGMTFSTLKVVRHVEAFTPIEHPIGWTNEQILAGVTNRSADILGRTRFWDAETETTAIEEIHPGKYEPDDVDSEPLALTDADLTAAPAPVIVETPPES